MDALKSKGQMLDQINLEKIPRSGFDLSFNNKGTGKIGRIIPTRCMETLPGDSIKGSSQAALQFEPLAVPILANMNVRQETWYVPNHILLDTWDTLISKGEDLSDNSKVGSFSLKQLWRIFTNSTTGLLYPFKFSPVKNINFIQNPFLYNRWAPSSGVVQTKCMFVDIDSLLDNLRSASSGFDNNIANSFVGQFQLEDIYFYRKKVIDNFITIVEDLYSTYGEKQVVISDSDDGGTITSYLRVLPLYQSYDKYVDGAVDYQRYYALSFHDYLHPTDNEDLRVQWHKFDLNQYDSNLLEPFGVNADDNIYYLFSEFSIAFCQFIYDYLSPVIGSSSLLDYLGYPSLNMTDIVYLFHEFCMHNFGELNIASHNAYPFQFSSIVDKLADYLSTKHYSDMPLRAYYTIWYNNYRDKLLETKCSEPQTATTLTNAYLFQIATLRVRCWSKDTFNTALSNTGTGNMVVPISDILSSDRKKIVTDGVDSSRSNLLDLNLCQYTLDDGTTIELPTRYLSLNGSIVDYSDGISAFSLDTLRRAGRTEKWIQKALIYGNLIQDSLFTHWGVKIKNERIQLPEFVTSSSQLVQVSTLVNNTTTAESVAGDKSAFASAFDTGGQFDFYCPENGYLISFLTILPEQTYSYGVPRHLSKFSIFDFAFPEFAQIGMDAIYNEEIRSGATKYTESYNSIVFGYQGRYYDYKCKQDEEHGELRTTQDMYTFARDFNPYDSLSRPSLNYIFVHCWPSLDMFVTDDLLVDLFRYDIHHSVAASRALPVCGMSV